MDRQHTLDIADELFSLVSPSTLGRSITEDERVSESQWSCRAGGNRSNLRKPSATLCASQSSGLAWTAMVRGWRAASGERSGDRPRQLFWRSSTDGSSQKQPRTLETNPGVPARTLEESCAKTGLQRASRRISTVQPADYDAVAGLYDVYVTVDFDVPFFKAEALRASGPVLELTSGTGRLSLPLIEAGVDLTCVDGSRGMLDVLARKLAERNLSADIQCADVCSLTLAQQFELAILPFNAFMEIVGQERQRAALSAVFAWLRPGGRFICTLHNPAVRRRHVDGVLRVVGRFPFEDGNLVVSGFEQGGEPVVSRLQFYEYFGSDGRLAWKRSFPQEFELIERGAFEEMAISAGFRVLQLHRNYERAPFDPARSPFMIWVLAKPLA